MYLKLKTKTVHFELKIEKKVVLIVISVMLL